ncbi:MAG TPA: polymorphic toxin-type HINT domain-containing protein [Pirellulaceae bacterium]|nr:polymorphic toxin-type HINT domain-containing protein [Pirellulaceae bacterium]
MDIFLRKCGIVVCGVFVAFCLWKAVPGLVGDSAQASAAHTSTTRQQASDLVGRTKRSAVPTSAQQTQLVTTPIQDLRVGMRVVGRNPLDEDAQRDLPEPESATWRLVRAAIEMQPGRFCHVELLRPIEWVEANEAEVGATIWLELPELFVEGNASVLAVEPCPPLDPGTNPMITGTFRHEAESVVDLYVECSREPIGCTSEHPFWSTTRDDFVAASELDVGEEVLTAYGNSARITSIVPRAGPETVYGLEVYGEHVYHVGGAGLLAHNASSRIGTQNPSTAWAAKTGRAYDRRFRTFWRQFEGQDIGDWEVASVNRRLAKGIQPDLVLVNHQRKLVNVHDITSAYDLAHVAKG